MGMAVGIGYKLANKADTFHFHPHLGIGIDAVEVREDNPLGIDRGELAVVLNLGTAVRWMPTRHFGFHAALDALLTNVDNEYTGVVYTGINTMFGGGITLRF